MAQQLVFDLPVRPAMGRGDFFVSASNEVALARVDAWREWSFGKLVLAGPEGSGKTHLAHVWAGQSGARIISASDVTEADVAQAAAWPALALEDVDRVAGDAAAEARIFHLHNALAATGAPLLLTGRRPPARWGSRPARPRQPHAPGRACSDRRTGRQTPVGTPAEAFARPRAQADPGDPVPCPAPDRTLRRGPAWLRGAARCPRAGRQAPAAPVGRQGGPCRGHGARVTVATQ